MSLDRLPTRPESEHVESFLGNDYAVLANEDDAQQQLDAEKRSTDFLEKLAMVVHWSLAFPEPSRASGDVNFASEAEAKYFLLFFLFLLLRITARIEFVYGSYFLYSVIAIISVWFLFLF